MGIEPMKNTRMFGFEHLVRTGMMHPSGYLISYPICRNEFLRPDWMPDNQEADGIVREFSLLLLFVVLRWN